MDRCGRKARLAPRSAWPSACANGAPVTGFSTRVSFLTGYDGMELESVALGADTSDWTLLYEEDSDGAYGSLLISANGVDSPRQR